MPALVPKIGITSGLLQTFLDPQLGLKDSGDKKQVFSSIECYLKKTHNYRNYCIITSFKTHEKLKENGLNYQEFWKVGRVQVLNWVLFGSNYLEGQENRILLCNISVACVQTSPTFFITCRKWTEKVGDFSDICMQANISVILSVLSCNFLRPQLFKRWMIALSIG